MAASSFMFCFNTKELRIILLGISRGVVGTILISSSPSNLSQIKLFPLIYLTLMQLVANLSFSKLTPPTIMSTLHYHAWIFPGVSSSQHMFLFYLFHCVQGNTGIVMQIDYLFLFFYCTSTVVSWVCLVSYVSSASKYLAVKQLLYFEERLPFH